MARHIAQVRYYRDGDKRNYPPSSSTNPVTSTKLIDGSQFLGNLPIVQLGVQALPGTKFYINTAQTPIVVGATGIYEIDLSGYASISELKFDADSIRSIRQSDRAYLIIDYIYEKQEG